MRSLCKHLPAFLVSAFFLEGAGAQSPPGPNQSPPPPAQTLAQKPGGVTISLDQADPDGAPAQSQSDSCADRDSAGPGGRDDGQSSHEPEIAG